MNLAQVCQVLEKLVPVELAAAWDNVGLLAGDERSPCDTILLTIDLTPAVLAEAIDKKVSLIIAYHPPLFKPISRLSAQSQNMDALVWKAIRHGIAIYAMHTALDAAQQGTNDVLAQICGAVDVKPLEYHYLPTQNYKMVVFVPPERVDDVAQAMQEAGAGVIGAYTRCSFRLPGTGTFLGDSGTHPAIGQAGRYETVQEIRLEMVTPQSHLSEVIGAIHQSHPYEEPAYDVYPLIDKPLFGIGRMGRLEQTPRLADLRDQLKKKTPTRSPQMIGQPHARIERVAVVAGAAGELALKISLGPADALITGELRHHEALTLRRTGTNAIILGHWASERPVLAHFAQRCHLSLPDLPIFLSEADCDPYG